MVAAGLPPSRPCQNSFRVVTSPMQPKRGHAAQSKRFASSVAASDVPKCWVRRTPPY